ncbi:thiol methyltransferase 1 [Daedaleopsis nitida]|nr:thiol methyltransferase 1 [Daedaleopsis nitida]
MSLSQEEIIRLSAQVIDLLDAHKEKGWDEAWKGEITPWDGGAQQPALKHLLESSGIDFPRSGTALVPGCGRGYDAITIASILGLKTLGIDIAPTAVKAANDYLKSSGAEVDVTFRVGDFFAQDTPVDLVHDYTFFSALPPSRRPEWGRQMAKLVKPGGFLIVLIYPILPYTEVGPPFYVRPEHYDEALGDGWEKLLDIAPEVTLKSHVGKERLIVRRKL